MTLTDTATLGCIEVVELAPHSWTWRRWSQGGDLVASGQPCPRRRHAIREARRANGSALNLFVVPSPVSRRSGRLPAA